MTDREGAVATQRLFFALWPDAALQYRFFQSASAFLPGLDVPRVPIANLHCTLVFLGNVKSVPRLCLEDAASSVRVERFTLTFDRFGYFRRPRIGWLGCKQTPAALQALVAQLTEVASVCGFPSERRQHELHLSIVRKLCQDPGRLIVMPISWEVERFALVESVRGEEGVQYRPLRFWQLQQL